MEKVSFALHHIWVITLMSTLLEVNELRQPRDSYF